jgi:hypothetical protein
MEHDFRRLVFIIMFVFVAGSIIISLLATKLHLGVRQEPSIPVYPSAQNPRSRLIQPAGWQNLSFHVSDNYPSIAIYTYYRQVLTAQGYTPNPPNANPVWKAGKTDGNKRKLVFAAQWFDAQRLRAFDLEITAIEKLDIDPATKQVVNRTVQPGLEVSCTLARKVIVD